MPGVSSFESLANPTPIQSNVSQLFQATLGFADRAAASFSAWQSLAANAGLQGYQAYVTAKQSGDELVKAAKIQANALQMAASQAGIAAASVYDATQANIASVGQQGKQAVSDQKLSYINAGLSLAGSPGMLMNQTIEQVGRQQRYIAMQGAQQERALRQQQQNIVQESNLTLQSASQQANLLAVKGWNTWLTTSLQPFL